MVYEGNSKRKLYTDDEDVIYSYRRCIGINGINCVALKPDLLDRSILIELQRIQPSERKEEKKLLAQFNKLKQTTLGGIFDVLVKTLGVYSEVILPVLPRMADFARWGYAAAEVLGIGGQRFLQTYHFNTQTQHQQVVEGNPLATCLVEFIKERGEWIGTASELLGELSDRAEKLKINTNSRGWVKTPNHLTRKINLLRVNLEELGISYEREHKEKGTFIHLNLKEVDSIISSVRPSESAPKEGVSPDDNLMITDAKDMLASGPNPMPDKRSDDADDNDGKIPAQEGYIKI